MPEDVWRLLFELGAAAVGGWLYRRERKRRREAEAARSAAEEREFVERSNSTALARIIEQERAKRE